MRLSPPTPKTSVTKYLQDAPESLPNKLYPDKFLRGIPNKDFYNEEADSPQSHLFHIKGLGDPKRTDNKFEESINWMDTNEAINVLFDQKNDKKETQFKIGAAVILKSEIDRISRLPIVKKQLEYERKRIPNNEFHGNLLLNKSVPKKIMNQIAASIALSCESVIQQSNLKEPT